MLTGLSAFCGTTVPDGIAVGAMERYFNGHIRGKMVIVGVAHNASSNTPTATLIDEFTSDSSIGAITLPTYELNCLAAYGLPIAFLFLWF